MTWKRALIGLLVVVVLLAGGLFTYFRFFAPQDDAASPADPLPNPLPQGEGASDPLPTGAVTAEGRLIPLRRATLALDRKSVV